MCSRVNDNNLCFIISFFLFLPPGDAERELRGLHGTQRAPPSGEYTN